MGKKSKRVVLSETARVASKNYKNYTNLEIVKDYMQLEMLPTNKDLIIDKIGVYNWDSVNKKPRNLIKYGLFTSLKPDEFPLGVNPELDYMPEDDVSPVVIISTNGVKYRVDDLLWFPLVEISDAVMLKQGKTGQKVFPQKIFIDETIINEEGYKSNKWIANLKNLSAYSL